MTLSIFFPGTNRQKLTEMDNEQKLSTSYKKCIATEVATDARLKTRKIMWYETVKGKTDKSFTMKQSVLMHGRVGLLLREWHSSYRQRIERRKCKFALGALWIPI